MENLDQILEFNSSPELKEKLYLCGVLRNYTAGSVIVNEDYYVTHIPIVTKGVLKVIRTEADGRTILLYYIKLGEGCIMSFLGSLMLETKKVRIEVEEDSEILFIPLDKVLLFMKEYPQWFDYIFGLYNKRFEELLDAVNDLAFKKVDERLLALIKKKAEMTQSKIIHITHEQLANELGTARVVVSRLLKHLEEIGTIKLGRNKFTISNISSCEPI